MSADNFERCTAFVLAHEGGATFTNDPRDPGGATKYGITLRTLEAWRKRPQDPSDVKGLGEAEARSIYATLYWTPTHGEELPAGVDLMVYDFGVNAGPGRSIRLLQTALGFIGKDVDGALGPKSLLAVRGAGKRALIKDLAALQLSYYQGLPGWATYGNGWTNRLKDRQLTAERMLVNG